MIFFIFFPSGRQPAPVPRDDRTGWPRAPRGAPREFAGDGITKNVPGKREAGIHTEPRPFRREVRLRGRFGRGLARATLVDGRQPLLRACIFTPDRGVARENGKVRQPLLRNRPGPSPRITLLWGSLLSAPERISGPSGCFPASAAGRAALRLPWHGDCQPCSPGEEDPEIDRRVSIFDWIFKNCSGLPEKSSGGGKRGRLPGRRLGGADAGERGPSSGRTSRRLGEGGAREAERSRSQQRPPPGQSKDGRRS